MCPEWTQSGQRAIMASGWGGLAPENLPEDILLIDQAPHDWLLPQMAAVIHHGGAGSTAAGLRAGKPTLIIPFFGDQPFWGNQVYWRGVGPKPIRPKKLTVDELTTAIRQMTTDRVMIEKASQLGERIRNENGVQNAVLKIEEEPV